MWTAVLSLLVLASPVDNLERAVANVVEGLHLDNLDGFDVGTDLGLTVDLTRAEDGDALRPVVLGLVRAHLVRLGVRSVIAVSPGHDVAARAQRDGAEWLLLVTGDRTTKGHLRLFVSLRLVDRGLWAPVTDGDTTAIYAIAEETFRLPTAPPPSPPPPDGPPPDTLSKIPTLRGPAVSIGTLPGRVVAMAACRLTEVDTDVLVVLTADALTALTYDRHLTPLARFELASLPRADMPVRDPLGAIVCGGTPSRVAFGHSDLHRGYVLRFQQKGRGRFSWKRESELEGIPVVKLDDGWLLAHPDEGTNRYAGKLRSSTGAPTFEFKPTHALTAAGSVWFASDGEGRLRAGGPGFVSETEVGRSGTALATLQGSGLLFYTAPVLDDGRDVVSMYSTEYRPSSIQVVGAIRALSAGWFQAGAASVIASIVRPDTADTELFLVSLDGVEVAR